MGRQIGCDLPMSVRQPVRRFNLVQGGLLIHQRLHARTSAASVDSPPSPDPDLGTESSKLARASADRGERLDGSITAPSGLRGQRVGASRSSTHFRAGKVAYKFENGRRLIRSAAALVSVPSP